MKKILTTYGKLLYIGLFVALYGLFRYKPALTEQWYSTGLYPYIGRTVRFLLGWIPFSVGDVLYTILPLAAVYYIVRYFKQLRKTPLRFLRKIGEGLVHHRYLYENFPHLQECIGLLVISYFNYFQNNLQQNS